MPNLAQVGGSSLLKEALTDYPLPHHLIIFDCRATLEFLGFVINNVEDGAEHQRLSRELPPRYKARGYRVFSPIKHYTAFINAWSEGVPLRLHRTTHPALEPIEEIAQAIVQQIQGGQTVKGGSRGKARSTRRR